MVFGTLGSFSEYYCQDICHLFFRTITMMIKAVLHLFQQLLAAAGSGAQVQAEGAAGVVALVLTAQRQVGLKNRHRQKRMNTTFGRNKWLIN